MESQKKNIKEALVKETDHERELKDLEKIHKDEVKELKAQIERLQKTVVTKDELTNVKMSFLEKKT